MSHRSSTPDGSVTVARTSDNDEPLYRQHTTSITPPPLDMSPNTLRLSVCPSCSFIHSARQTLLPRHLMNGLSNLDDTYSEYSVAHTDVLVRSWRSKVKGQGHSRPSKVEVHLLVITGPPNEPVLFCSLVCRLSSSVTLRPEGGRAGRRQVGDRAADTARRASTVTSR